MRKSVFLRELEEQLWNRGCPRERMRELVRELAEHREDLRLAEMSHGAPEAQAEANAEARLGDSRKVAADLMAACRQAHWWGRYPIFSFCFLPLVTGILSFGLLLTCSVLFIRAFGDLFLNTSWFGGGPALEWMDRGLFAMYCAAVFGTAIAFSKLARDSGAGWRWVFAVCVTCAMEGYAGHPSLEPHNFSFALRLGEGYGPNWICGALPLLLAAVTYLRVNRISFGDQRMGRGSMVLLIGTLACSTVGCTSQGKPEYQRGWIGGEYKVVPRLEVSGATNTPASEQPSEKAQRKGLLVLALGANSPARSAGLREGDLILKVNHRPVTALKALYRNIDRSEPGKGLPVLVSREGTLQEFNVLVGRETYEKSHFFSLGLFIHPLKIGGEPSVSLVVLGYDKVLPTRLDLTSVENRYLARANSAAEFTNPGWTAWAGIVEIGGSDKIVKQEPTAQAGSL